MRKEVIAKELLKIAKYLIAYNFVNKKQYQFCRVEILESKDGKKFADFHIPMLAISGPIDDAKKSLEKMKKQTKQLEDLIRWAEKQLKK